jgi:hypothetical protein
MTSDPDPELVVHQVAHYQPVAYVGTDEHGRTLVTCPSCGTPAPILEGGRIACPLGDGVMEYLRREVAARMGPATPPAGESKP